MKFDVDDSSLSHLTKNVANKHFQTDCGILGACDHLVHSCTIFLCSLDVRNIVQGGNPLYAAFFLHRALEAILDQNECVFLQKTTV